MSWMKREIMKQGWQREIHSQSPKRAEGKEIPSRKAAIELETSFQSHWPNTKNKKELFELRFKKKQTTGIKCLGMWIRGAKVNVTWQ